MRFFSLLILWLVFCLAATFAVAGDMTPDNPPGTTSFYTLEDIWERLKSGTDGAPGAFSEPSAVPDPAGTGRDLNEIMSVAPEQNAGGALSSDVLKGKTFWGLTSGEWGLRTGTRPPAPAAYSGSPGDTTGVDWPDPRFTVNGDGTVTDNLTGLMWLQDGGCFNKRVWTDVDTTAEILAILSGAGCANYTATYDDWRLPTIFELHSLVLWGALDPAVPNTAGDSQWTTNGDPFFNVNAALYWSATSLANLTSIAWWVSLYTGETDNYNKTGAYYIWPVRGGE